MQQTFTGGCLCGAVRYRCSDPTDAPTLCHCTSCRRGAGAHVVGWLTVPMDRFVFTVGAPQRYASSSGVERTFCAACGTSLTYRTAARPAEIDVTLGSLDDPHAAAPADHVWLQDAPAWDRPGDGLPQHAASRPPSAAP
jgi:hypothetical protein